jgi:hypothetical protein
MADELFIGLYQKTTAHFKEGKVTSIYNKLEGQGPKVVLERSEEAAIELGGEYSLVLQPVEDVTPPIGILPEFPELPTPELPTLPPVTGVMPELPGGITPPIGTLPPQGLMPTLPPYYPVPPIGTLPPQGLMPTLPGGFMPPIWQFPQGVMPSLPGGFVPPIWQFPQGVMPTLPPQGGATTLPATVPPGGPQVEPAPAPVPPGGPQVEPEPTAIT